MHVAYLSMGVFCVDVTHYCNAYIFCELHQQIVVPPSPQLSKTLHFFVQKGKMIKDPAMKFSWNESAQFDNNTLNETCIRGVPLNWGSYFVTSLILVISTAAGSGLNFSATRKMWRASGAVRQHLIIFNMVVVSLLACTILVPVTLLDMTITFQVIYLSLFYVIGHGKILM